MMKIVAQSKQMHHLVVLRRMVDGYVFTLVLKQLLTRHPPIQQSWGTLIDSQKKSKQHQINALGEKLDKLQSGMLCDIKCDNTIYKEITNKPSGMKHTDSKLSMSDINKEIS